MAEITKQELEHLLETEDDEFVLETFRRKHDISPTSSGLYVNLGRLVAERKWKRIGRGIYRRIRQVQAVKWWDGDDAVPLDFKFPKAYECDEEIYVSSEFGIEELVEVFAGDMVLITGRSNFGKTALALSILGENLGLMPGILMGSEYTASDGKISPKFKRRMKRMKWAQWMNGDGVPRFQLLPVGSDYEDYIEPDHINVIDWISLPGEYYLIDRVMKAIKDRVGNGVAVVVLQKNKDAEFGEGGERTQRYADVELRIDAFGDSGESLLTIGKVKSPKGRATGRTFAFDIVDHGANLHRIREVVKCRTCWGKGWKKSGNTSIPCTDCNKIGYVDK